MSEEKILTPIEELTKDGKLRDDEKFYYYTLSFTGGEVLIRKRITFGEMQNFEAELTRNKSVDVTGHVAAGLDGFENFLRKKILTYAQKVLKDNVESPLTRETLDSMDAEEIIDINNILDAHYNMLKKKQRPTTAR